MTDESDIEYEFDSPEDIEAYVVDQLSRLGIDNAFEWVDATNSDAMEFDIDGATIEPGKYAFELPFDDDDDAEKLGEELTWRTNGMIREIGRDIYEVVEDETPWADNVPAALGEIDGDAALILGNTTGGWVGLLGAPVSIWTDSVSLPVDTALVADMNEYGVRVTRESIDTLQYREEERDQDVIRIQFRRGYAVTNPDAGRLVRLSEP